MSKFKTIFGVCAFVVLIGQFILVIIAENTENYDKATYELVWFLVFMLIANDLLRDKDK